MIGAMPAVAVRHERRKKKHKDKRPKKLLLKPYQGGQNDGTMSPGSAQPSRVGSRAGSPTHGNQNGNYCVIKSTFCIVLEAGMKIQMITKFIS